MMPYVIQNPQKEMNFFFLFCFLYCHWLFFRISRPVVFCKKGVLRNFAKFIGKHLCQNLFFDKVAGLRPETLLKKRLCHRCFPMNFAEFLRTPFLQNTSGRLLLALHTCKIWLNECFLNSWHHICGTSMKMYWKSSENV